MNAPCSTCLADFGLQEFPDPQTYSADHSTKLLVSWEMTRSTGMYWELSWAKRWCWGLWRCWKVAEAL